MDAGEEIHRLELFGFFQTNLGKKSEQNLQKTISSSIYWKNEKRTGIYKLYEDSKSLINKFFNEPKYQFPKNKIYVISREIYGRVFSVELNGNIRRVRAYIDGKQIRGIEAIEELKTITTINKAAHSTSLLWNWIIDGNYYWEL